MVATERPAHLFNSETGRQAAYASHQAIAELKEDGLRFREMAIEQAKLTPEQKTSDNAMREVLRQIELTNEQIALTRSEIARMSADSYGYCEHCKRHGADGKELAALRRELRGFMEHLCRLRGIGEPARIRPANDTRKAAQAVPQLPEPTIGSGPATGPEVVPPKSL